MKLSALLLISLIVVGCGGKKNTPTPATPAPVKATLTLPAQNATCTTGTIVSDSLSSITFTWAASDNTDSYEVNIKNLLNNQTKTQSTNGTQLSVNLIRNTPYSWFVVSKSSKITATAQSDTWKFYNAGAGIVSYSPFPADISSPTLGQTVTASGGVVDLTWKGSDVDNDITGYDVYFGTSTTPPILKAGVTDMFLNNVAVSGVTTYYWKVVTKDSKGNTSDSGLFQFAVN